LSLKTEKSCYGCGDKLDPLIYRPQSKFCEKCVAKRVKERGLKRYYKNRYGTVRVSISIPIDLKNYIDRNYIDLIKFVVTKIEELKNKA
jgi:hypothetical protein